MKGITRREFARRDGCDEKLVRRALERGYLFALDDGSIDPALVKSGWREAHRRNGAPEIRAGVPPRLPQSLDDLLVDNVSEEEVRMWDRATRFTAALVSHCALAQVLPVTLAQGLAADAAQRLHDAMRTAIGEEVAELMIDAGVGPFREKPDASIWDAHTWTPQQVERWLLEDGERRMTG